MGVLPLQFKAGENVASLGLTGEETFDIGGLAEAISKKTVKVRAKKADGTVKEIDCVVRIDTPQEILYYENGGILPYVLRQLLAKK
jgi:aconitate hydratase